MRSSCCGSLAAVLAGLGIACPSFSQTSSGPATLESLLNSAEFTDTPAATEQEASGAGSRRPPGTVARPKDGVQHPDLDKAWAYYEVAVGKANEALRHWLAAQFEHAASQGDLDRAERWQNALERFEQFGELPNTSDSRVVVGRAVADYKKARDELSGSYEAVVKALTMEKKVAEARAARDECAAFRSVGKRAEDTPRPSQPSSTRLPKALRLLVGSRWKYHHTAQVFVLGEKGEALALDGTTLAIWSIEGDTVRLRQPQGEWEDVMVVSPDGMTMAGSTKAGKPVVATRVIE